MSAQSIQYSRLENKGFGYMLHYTGLAFLIIAVSLDGFGVGATYGMRRIRVPINALLIIMLCSGIVVFLSMTIGNFLRSFISPHIAGQVGGVILIALGIFSLVNVLRSKFKQHEANQQTKSLQKHRWRTVITTPAKADLDQSGIISANEAILLGVALALDAFGAGIGASVAGYSPFLTTILVACMSGLFVYSGIQMGLVLAEKKYLKQLAFIPPILLMILGLINLI